MTVFVPVTSTVLVWKVCRDSCLIAWSSLPPTSLHLLAPSLYPNLYCHWFQLLILHRCHSHQAIPCLLSRSLSTVVFLIRYYHLFPSSSTVPQPSFRFRRRLTPVVRRLRSARPTYASIDLLPPSYSPPLTPRVVPVAFTSHCQGIDHGRL